LKNINDFNNELEKDKLTIDLKNQVHLLSYEVEEWKKKYIAQEIENKKF